MVLLFDFREQLGCEGVAFGHRFQQLRTGQLVPRGGDNPGRCVVAAQQCNAFVKLFGLHALGAAQNDRACVLDLVVEEFAEVFHIHFCFGSVGDGHERVKLDRLVFGDTLDGMDYVGKLANAGGLDQDAVGVVSGDDLLERLAEIADQRAADAAGIHLGDLDTSFLEEAAVDADLAKFIFYEDNLLALQRFFQQLFDERGLACAKKTGDNINFSHMKHFFLYGFFLIYQ